MTDMKLAKGMTSLFPVNRFCIRFLTNLLYSIIQDCEDALTNWVEAKAAVRSRLSQRGSRPHRTHGRVTRAGAGEGVSLADQDRPMQRGSSEWVPADEHHHRNHRENDDDYEDITDDENGHHRHLDGDGTRGMRGARNGAVLNDGGAELHARDGEAVLAD